VLEALFDGVDYNPDGKKSVQNISARFQDVLT
jgi:hypothetical protein